MVTFLTIKYIEIKIAKTQIKEFIDDDAPRKINGCSKIRIIAIMNHV